MTPEKAKAAICIPARTASSRFPGKLLEDLGGKTLLAHVVEVALCCTDRFDIFVLAGDSKIEDEVGRLGVACLRTRSDLRNGTERIANVLSELNYEFYVNLQADDPTIAPELIYNALEVLEDSKFQVVTPVFEINRDDEVENQNLVKVVLSANRDFAVYFSRLPLPLNYRNIERKVIRYGHIGLYGYKKSALEQYRCLQPTYGEELESLEQLRFVENGIPIGVFKSRFQPNAVDSLEDLQRLRRTWEME